MKGATGNIYAGLHEFAEMAFVLHMLRRDDLFVDVGANCGSYTILAGAAVGAQCISFEPLPDTYRHLVRNICLNDMKDRVKAHNIGIGKEDGVLRFTSGLDCGNHVASGDEISCGATLEVGITSLDNVVGNLKPKLIKIDVEGFESNVIAGACRTLAKDTLDGVIMELNGSGSRYGFDEIALHNRMLAYGFAPFSYEPFTRSLLTLDGKNAQSCNTLYLRNMERVTERLAAAPPFHVLNQAI